MHHFRGILKEGSEPRLDPANVYIEYLGPQDGTRSNWNGYLLVSDESALERGVLYTLELSDGRTGDLIVDRFVPDDSAPGRLRAIFYTETPLA